MCRRTPLPTTPDSEFSMNFKSSSTKSHCIVLWGKRQVDARFSDSTGEECLAKES